MISKRTISHIVIAGLLISLSACSSKESDNVGSADRMTTSENISSNSRIEPEETEQEQKNEAVSSSLPQETKQETKDSDNPVKKEYGKQIQRLEEETEEKRASSSTSSTYELKNIEGFLFDEWDGLLNEIYSVLEGSLLPEKMAEVRQEQREWLTKRDETAKEASLKFEGGTGEQLEYTKTLNDLTAKRCKELVENYME